MINQIVINYLNYNGLVRIEEEKGGSYKGSRNSYKANPSSYKAILSSYKRNPSSYKKKRGSYKKGIEMKTVLPDEKSQFFQRFAIV